MIKGNKPEHVGTQMQLSVSEVAWRIQNRIRSHEISRQRAKQHASDSHHFEVDIPFTTIHTLPARKQPDAGWEAIKAPVNPMAQLPDNQVLLITKPYFFEPNHGYMVDLERQTYIRESVRYDTWMCLDKQSWKYPLIYFGRPLLSLSSMQIHRVPLAVSLVHAFPENYYHFINDVLARLPVILEFLTPECVVILPAGSTDSAFEKELLGHPSWGGVKFVDPKYTHIIAEETILIRGGTPKREDWLAIQDRLVTVRPLGKRRKCLFVIRGTRPDGSLYDRSVQNELAVVELLKNNDVDAVSFGGMSVARQMELINSYEHVISAHGAALTNICWVTSPDFSLTEIHMADRKIDCYQHIVNVMGWKYNPLIEGISYRQKGTTLYKVDAQHVLDAA